jgi:hypothetical protein
MPTERRVPSAPPATATPARDPADRSGSEGFRLTAAKLTVTLLDDPNRARFAYECHLETTGEVPARYWCYHLPAAVPEVSEIHAWDGRGKLQPRLYASGEAGSRLEVRLRYPLLAGARYTFAFGYECSIRPVVVRDAQRCTVTYADWVSFDIPCTLLQISVELPAGAELVAAVPACAEGDDGRVTYRVRALRPLETVSFLVAYRSDGSRAPKADVLPPPGSPCAKC